MKKDYIIVLVGYVLINVVLFHGILLQYPDIIRGDRIVFQEELTPYFNLRTQYFDNIISTYDALVDREEIRTEYYFTTGWVRYYLILPIMLVFLNAVAGYLIWFSANILYTKFCCRNLTLEENICIFFSTLPPYLLLMYSKITHFYSLIFGFSIFCLAISMYLAIMKKRDYKYLIIISILLFLNPAIHYIFLFFPIAAIITLYFLLLSRFDKTYNKYNIIGQYFSLIFIVLVPKYVLFTILLSTGDVLQSIPVSYESAKALSIYPFLKNIALESIAPINIILYDSKTYLTDKPNYFFILFTALLPISLFIKSISKNEKIISRISIFLFLIGIVFSLGPHSFLSYYRYIFQLIDLPYIGNLFFYYLQVLRTPNRWQFLEYYSMIFPISLVLIWLYHKIMKSSKRNLVYNKVFVLSIIFVIIIIPFTASERYMNTFISGNYNGFLEPYTIPQELKDIKKILEDKKDGRLLVLPPGSGLILKTDQNNINYAYTDAIYIYYFNVPSIEIGYISGQDRRMLGFLVWYSMANLDDELFYKLLVDNNVSKIFIHDDARSEYLSIDDYMYNLDIIIGRLQKKNKVKTIYSSNKYLLIDIDKTDENGKYYTDTVQIDADIKLAIKLYKVGKIPYINLLGISEDDVKANISKETNENKSNIYIYDIPYSSKDNVTPSYGIMVNSPTTIRWYYTISSKHLVGTYGTVNSDYMILKNNANVEYDIRIPGDKYMSIYVRSLGDLYVNIYDMKGARLCGNELHSDSFRNIYVCDISDKYIKVKFGNLKGFSAIDSIISVPILELNTVQKGISI